jgi:hypothetical protein
MVLTGRERSNPSAASNPRERFPTSPGAIRPRRKKIRRGKPIVRGGPTRGFSQIMPSFGEALSSGQIDRVIRYLRGFCRNHRWPRGELNLPRALVTEKAYPENEAAFNAKGAPGVTSHMIHEQRFGMNNQIEIDVPLTFQDQNHTWFGGHVEVELWYQPIGFRWAHNLNLYPAAETRRFVSYYESMPSNSAIVLARTAADH